MIITNTVKALTTSVPSLEWAIDHLGESNSKDQEYRDLKQLLQVIKELDPNEAEEHDFEHSQLQKLRTGDLTFFDVKNVEPLNDEQTKVEGTMSNPGLNIVISAFADCYFSSSATNFLSLNFEHGESGQEFVVDIRRKDGVSPAEKAGNACQLLNDTFNILSEVETDGVSLVARHPKLADLQQTAVDLQLIELKDQKVS